MTTERKSERSGIKIGDKDYTLLVAKAIKTFWNTKKKQLIASGDTSNRGAVVGGKQMDEFINLLQAAAIELKSQIGSYGNNFNNRTEEAIGVAIDFWTAFREGQFPNQQAPWVGWLMVVGHDKASVRAVRNYEPHFLVRPEFNGANYIDRYRILCQKLILERHYTSAALLWTKDADSYGDVSNDISIHSFLASFVGYLNGVASEFK